MYKKPAAMFFLLAFIVFPMVWGYWFSGAPGNEMDLLIFGDVPISCKWADEYRAVVSVQGDQRFIKTSSHLEIGATYKINWREKALKKVEKK